MGGLPAVLVGYEMDRNIVRKVRESKALPKDSYSAIGTLLQELSELTNHPVQFVFTDEPGDSDREGNYAFVCFHVEESMDPTEAKDLLAIAIPDGFEKVKAVLGIPDEAQIKHVFVPYASTFSSEEF